DDVRPEAGSVLADAPALLFEAPFLFRDLQVVLRLAGGTFLGRVKEGEVFADDLFRRVALDPLRAVVPRSDVARGIEHEDRVVLHAVDEQAEQLLAAAELFLLLAMAGHVARDLGEADERAALVAQRGDHGVRPEAG